MIISQRDFSLLHEKFTDESKLRAAVEKVKKGEPLAYVLGEWYFYGLTFKLNRDCLIPRPDTEHIVEATVNRLPQNGRFIDLCSGSGCIAISVLANRPDITADAVELSRNAYDISIENARVNGVGSRFNAINADLFKFTTEEKYHCIVSNPPYIRTEVIRTLDPSVRDHEPTVALDGGDDGMRFYRYILSEFRCNLADDGCFVFEIGFDQKEDITRLASEFGYSSCKVTKDYGGNDRVAVIKI